MGEPLQASNLETLPDPLLRPHKCTLCGFCFKTRGHLSEHMNFYHKKGSVTCSECTKVFPTSRDLRSHRIEHAVLSGRCPHCRTNILSKSEKLDPASFKQAYTFHLNSCSRKPNKRLSSLITSDMLDNISFPTQDFSSVPTHCSKCEELFENESFLKLHNCPSEICSSTIIVSSLQNGHDTDDDLSNNSDTNHFPSYPSSFCILCNVEFENEDDLSQHLYEEHQNDEPVVQVPALPISLPAPNVLYCYQSPKVPGEAPVIDVKIFSCDFCNKSFESDEAQSSHSLKCPMVPLETFVVENFNNIEMPSFDDEVTVSDEPGDKCESTKAGSNAKEDDNSTELAVETGKISLSKETEKDEKELENKTIESNAQGEENLNDKYPDTSTSITDNTQINLTPEKSISEDKLACDEQKKDNTSILIRWLCKYCKKTFGDRNEMKSHKKICLRNKTDSLSQVNENDVMNLVSKEITDENTDIFVRWICKYCREQFDDKSSMEKHKPNCKQREARRKSRVMAMTSDSDCTGNEKDSMVSSDNECYKLTPLKNINLTDEENSNNILDMYSEMPLLSKMTFPCEYCAESFDDDDEWNQHQSVCLKNPTNNKLLRLKCKTCSLTFPSKSLQEDHQTVCQIKHTSTSSFFAFCTLCKLKFTDVETYKGHKNQCLVPENGKKLNEEAAKSPNDKENQQCETCSDSMIRSTSCMPLLSKPHKIEVNSGSDVDSVEWNTIENDDNTKNSPVSEPSTSEPDDLSDSEHSPWEPGTSLDLEPEDPLTNCPRCNQEFENEIDLSEHTKICKVYPIPGNFEAFVNRNLPVLRCPSCKLFFRGTKSLVSHKCKTLKLERKRGSSSEDFEREIDTKRSRQSSEESCMKCSICEVVSKDYQMVLLSSGEDVNYACLPCFEKQKDTSPNGSRYIDRTPSPYDCLTREESGLSSISIENVMSIAPQKVSKNTSTFYEGIRNSYKLTSDPRNRSNVSPQIKFLDIKIHLKRIDDVPRSIKNSKPQPVVPKIEHNANNLCKISPITQTNKNAVPVVITQAYTSPACVVNINKNTGLANSLTTLLTVNTPNAQPSVSILNQNKPRPLNANIRTPVLRARLSMPVLNIRPNHNSKAITTLKPIFSNANSNRLINPNIKVPTTMNFTPVNQNQGLVLRPNFMTFVPFGSQTIRPNPMTSTGMLRFLTPNNLTFQVAGKPAVSNAKPMPVLQLGNPRMILRPPGGPQAPSVNEDNEKDESENRLSSDKENQKKRLPLSNVDDTDGWFLEGVTDDAGSKVTVKKCICGNCYRSFVNETALNDHAWTVHKRLITEKMRLKKIENVPQSVMKKALTFALDCSKNS